MKNIVLAAYFIVLCSISFAQLQKSDRTFREELAQQKEKFYREAMLNKQSITSNQEMYDVKHYFIDLALDPATETLRGMVKITGEVLVAYLDSVELNFWDGMTITDIHLSSMPDNHLAYSRNNDILFIALDSTFSAGEQFSVEISYNGSPQNDKYYSFHFDSINTKPMIYAVSTPFGARSWWPCKDVISDKADSVDIKVTVPGELIVASNGSLKEVIIEGDTATYWWNEQYPISTYLVSLAIHPYEIYYDDYVYNDNADTMKIHFYTFSGNYEQYRPINDKVKNIIAFYADLYGEYPFIKEKYGHADCTSPPKWNKWAVEHQTCTSFSYWNEVVYVHEAAHQWWGDMITCNSFHHIWLNEGFATYSEALWYEHAKYEDEPKTASEYQMTYNLYLGSGTVYVENPETDIIFDFRLSYQKATWILHMLRHIVGDSVFFNILKTYGVSPEHQYGTATTEDFQAICEQVSGLNLQKFFQQWVYEGRYPFYEYGWTVNPENNRYRVTLVINQIQQERLWKNLPLFWMPIDIEIEMENSDTTFVVWDSLKAQTFEFIVNEEPVNLQLDPDNWILKRSEVLTNIEYDYINIPEKFTMLQNYPNPFSKVTSVEFILAETSFVTLKVYNIHGHNLATLVSEKLAAGIHKYEWDAGNLPGGVYIYKLEAEEYTGIRKMLLVK